MPFKIFFKGLVCHVTDENGEVAVFVDGPPVPRHELRLIVPKPTDLLEPPRCKEDPSAAPERGRAFNIEGKVLSISGIAAAPKAVFSPAFDQTVPALRAFADCPGLAESVSARKITRGSGITGFLKHPAGDFDVEAYFPNQARFIDVPGPSERCVAKIVSLTLEPDDGNRVTISGGGAKFVFRPDSSIFIDNVAFGALGLMNGHFAHYGNVFSCGRLKGRVIEIPKACRGSQAVLPESPTSECSNSHVP